MRGDIRCIDGTSYKHMPQNDDPDFEIAIGRCTACEGKGCRQLFIAEAEAKIGEKIKTHYEFPPIPDRRFDWCAVTDNYDGEGSPIGWGRCEEDAIEDLVGEIEDRRAVSASFIIYNAAKLEVEAGKSSHNSFGWLDLSITETDGTTHDITIHFDTAEGFAMVLAHLQKAIKSEEDV